MNNCDNDTILEAVEKAIKHKARFYAYRMPGDSQLNFGAQIIDQHTPMGFIIHPFVEKPDCMPYYISAQFDANKFLKLPVSSLPVTSLHRVKENSTSKEEYLTNANKCIADMQAGLLKKVVLSRVIVSEYDDNLRWVDMFKGLLDCCPNSFVFVFNSEATGAWMGATPERYLSYHGKEITTMALAGTRLAGTEGEWSVKDIEEQQIVVDYIDNKFAEIKIEYEKSPLYTRQAGNVEHLCNDFKGKVTWPSQVDNMRNMLHPTPALAGMPVRDAVKYICSIESHNRLYYGGYIGPIDFRGYFDFFVNLRSLEFDGERYCMYVGGGLTERSIAEQEWLETCNKSELLLKLLNR